MATIKEIEDAIKERRGNLAAVGRKLGVSRQAISKRVKENKRLQEVWEETRETMLDDAETSLYDEALSGNTTALIFFLKTQGKSRGYTEKTEVAHEGGVTISLSWGDDDILE